MKWLKKYGSKTKGDWKSFRQFLADDWLPDFANSVTKPAEEPILLAVVTHSNFMMEGEIKRKCQEKYPIDSKSHKKKANNNQVVLIPYLWETQTCGPADNQTVRHRMLDASDEDQQCEVMANGTSLYDDEGKIK